jgi:hypothetical protein
MIMTRPLISDTSVELHLLSAWPNAMCVSTGTEPEGRTRMTTTMRTLRFGIEIETVGLRRKQLAQAIHSVVGGVIHDGAGADAWQVTDTRGRGWRVVPDGSLSDAGNSGEIVSPILGYEDIEQLQNIVRAVRRAGARADLSTGIHIHVDGSRFAVGHVINLVKFVHKQERLLEHVFAAHPDRGFYCKPIDPVFLGRLEAAKPRTMSDLRQAWYGSWDVQPDRFHGSRYRGLNLNSLFFRGTIEFRYFNGTLHAGEVKAYVQLVLALAAKAISAKAAHSKRRAFNPATAKYDFRVVLLRLGLIGEEFKTARLHLTKRLAGTAAWKHGRPDRAQGTSAPVGEQAEPERSAA